MDISTYVHKDTYIKPQLESKMADWRDWSSLSNRDLLHYDNCYRGVSLSLSYTFHVISPFSPFLAFICSVCLVTSGEAQ